MDLERDVEKTAHLSDSIKKEVVFETVRSVPEENVRNESDYARDPHKHTHLNWNPGFVKRFPWVGFGALFGVMACMGAAIAVLLISNDKSQDSMYGNRWPKWIAPSVILSGLSSVSSLCFSLAIANGVAIAWWRKTLKGATIKDLHKSWSFATSIKEVALAGRKFNLIALAALTTKLTIIDGVLMQSATKTVIKDDPIRFNVPDGIKVKLHQDFPVTGWVSPGNNGAGFMTNAMKNNLNDWETSLARPAFETAHGCPGVCFTNVTAIGFEFECGTQSSVDYDFNRLVNTSLSDNGTALRVFADALHYNDTMFKIAFTAEYSEASSIRMDLIWTQTHSYIEQYPYQADTGSGSDSTYRPVSESAKAPDSCQGRRFMQTCTLRPARVVYPIMIDNVAQAREGVPSDSGAAVVVNTEPQSVRVGAIEEWWEGPSMEDSYYPFAPANRQQQNFTIEKRLDIPEDHSDPFPGSSEPVNSKLAGIEVALNAIFGAAASLTKQQSGFIARQNGSAFSWADTTDLTYQSCNYSFMNPLKHNRDGSVSPSSIVGSINSMMLLLAADQYGFPDIPDHGYQANIYAKSIHYRTNIFYMIGACLSTFVCVLCVIPVYWGYWQLGRDVSLGPFEIAHAFQSPLTSEASQGSIRELMKEVGKREVKYGQYTTEDGRSVFVVADPDQLANLDRDTKAEFRAQMAHVMSRARSSRNNLPTLKTLGVKVEEKRDSA